MLEFKRGDLFRLDVDALVVPVNCVGVMGKGLASEFKKRFPVIVEPYEKLCEEKKLRLGHAQVVKSGKDTPKYIILFPTKAHWRENSLYTSISTGLQALIEKCDKLGIASVGLPALGCGEGKLQWGVIRPMIVRELSGSNVRFYVTEPLNTPDV